MMLDEKEFLRVEVNPGGTSKTLFLTANEIENKFLHLNTVSVVEAR